MNASLTNYFKLGVVIALQLAVNNVRAQTSNEKCLEKTDPIERLACYAQQTDELKAADKATSDGILNHKVGLDQLIRNKQYMQ